MVKNDYDPVSDALFELTHSLPDGVLDKFTTARDSNQTDTVI
jgi:hypothetical protein